MRVAGGGHHRAHQQGRGVAQIGLYLLLQLGLVRVAGPELLEVVGLGDEVRVLGEHLAHLGNRGFAERPRQRAGSKHGGDPLVVRQVDLQGTQPLQVPFAVERRRVLRGEHQHDGV